ncbi:MAG: NAD-dependent dehydratase [Ignavibacteriaceae bacterium]|nr:MAG: NAD-dependent dehydratase [Ignavibacteriaceae bacterium]
MKILITGGAGFIGSHMAESFLAKGWSVTVLDNFSSGRRENLVHISGDIEIIEGDIRDTAAVARAMSGADGVIHLAALASVPASFKNPVETYEVNFIGTENILAAALQHKVKHVTFASSSAVYGDTELLPITEETPDNPLSPYGLSKLLGEKLCRFYNTAFGLSVTVFRFFNVYGPRQNPFSEYSAVIPKFLSIIKEGGTPVIFGNGEQTRDFIYISDLVRAHELVFQKSYTDSKDYAQISQIDEESAKSVLNQCNPCNLYNLGSGTTYSLNQLVQVMSECLGREVKPAYAEARSGDILHSFCKIDKINAELTFKPEVTINSGIAKMINYYNLQG